MLLLIILSVIVAIILMYLRNGSSPTLPPVVTIPTLKDTTTATITPTETQLPPASTQTREPTLEPTTTPGIVPLPGLSVGDLHMHTLCSDGHNTYEEMVQGALVQGFTFIAITDHAWCPDALELCRNETRLLCIPGIELTGNTHIVALNLREPIERLLPVPEQVRLIHEQGGLAIAAHPFVPGYQFSPSDLLTSGFDAIECNVDGSDDPGFDISSLTCVWSSDAHDVSKLGTPVTYTVCDVLIRNFDELRAAILDGHCTYGQ